MHKISIIEESDSDEDEKPFSMRRLNIVECNSDDEAPPSSESDSSTTEKKKVRTRDSSALAF